MKTLLVATILSLMSASCFARASMTKDEIAQLPQEKVQSIKERCARQWGTDFDMRVFCEDQQYKALKILIDRN